MKMSLSRTVENEFLLSCQYELKRVQLFGFIAISNEKILKAVLLEFLWLTIIKNDITWQSCKMKYLLVLLCFCLCIFLMRPFCRSPVRVYSSSSQLPYKPYTADYPWSSLQLATYSMWHLLPSSNEFFMSLPLPLTWRRGLVSAPLCKTMPLKITVLPLESVTSLSCFFFFCKAMDGSLVVFILIGFIQRHTVMHGAFMR